MGQPAPRTKEEFLAMLAPGVRRKSTDECGIGGLAVCDETARIRNTATSYCLEKMPNWYGVHC